MAAAAAGSDSRQRPALTTKGPRRGTAFTPVSLAPIRPNPPQPSAAPLFAAPPKHPRLKERFDERMSPCPLACDVWRANDAPEGAVIGPRRRCPGLAGGDRGNSPTTLDDVGSTQPPPSISAPTRTSGHGWGAAKRRMGAAADTPGKIASVLRSRRPCDVAGHAPPRFPPHRHKRSASSHYGPYHAQAFNSASTSLYGSSKMHPTYVPDTIRRPPSSFILVSRYSKRDHEMIQIELCESTWFLRSINLVLNQDSLLFEVRLWSELRCISYNKADEQPPTSREKTS